MNQSITFSALLLVLASLTLAIPLSAKAEVESHHSAGFSVRIAGISKVPSDQVYAQFLRAGEWWNLEHSWFGTDSNMQIEPRAGGCFCEINGDKQVEHMRVVFVNPGQEVRLNGALGPLHMMGLRGVMSWKFEPIEDGSGTRITQRYIVTGYAEDGFEGLAAAVDSVQTDQLERLLKRLAAR